MKGQPRTDFSYKIVVVVLRVQFAEQDAGSYKLITDLLQEKYDEAESLHERAIWIWDATLGSDNPRWQPRSTTWRIEVFASTGKSRHFFVVPCGCCSDQQPVGAWLSAEQARAEGNSLVVQRLVGR